MTGSKLLEMIISTLLSVHHHINKVSHFDGGGEMGVCSNVSEYAMPVIISKKGKKKKKLSMNQISFLFFFYSN